MYVSIIFILNTGGKAGGVLLHEYLGFLSRIPPAPAPAPTHTL